MAGMLDFSTPLPRIPPPPTPLATPTQPSQSRSLPLLSHLQSAFSAIKSGILKDLELHISKLLVLNPSRREAIAQHLDRLAGLTAGPSYTHGNLDPAGGLRRWIDGPRTPAQDTAIQIYFEEIALLMLGQALLLKAWSDRNLRAWNAEDLGRLNWALGSCLKPHLPMDREGWQITRPNLYSWYNLDRVAQSTLWETLKSIRIPEHEGPDMLVSLIMNLRQIQPLGEPHGYDLRFYEALWKGIQSTGACTSTTESLLPRKPIIFCPTLRHGNFARLGPPQLNWLALESSAFQLILAELAQLWWKPAAPPFWSVGTGLEVHTKDQLAFPLGSPKPSLIHRITEMEACDLAVLFEERVIRTQGKSPCSLRLRSQLDALSFFKKLKSSGTSLGDLQACVALSKLRPGGMLLWAREEALSAQDGKEMLQWILDRAEIRAEWDFSELSHHLPSNLPLFPRHLYLFRREPDLKKRALNRPVKILVQGQIRSHIEIPLVLSDALSRMGSFGQKQAASAPLNEDAPASPMPWNAETPGFSAPPARENWSIQLLPSATLQQEWSELWPDPTTTHAQKKLERLRLFSVPLASFATIRQAQEKAIDSNWRGLWINCSEPNRLDITLLNPELENTSSGFFVLIPNPAWIAPLFYFLQSRIIAEWLDHQAERKNGRWALQEQIIKWIPIPKPLLEEPAPQLLQHPIFRDLESDWAQGLGPLKALLAQESDAAFRFKAFEWCAKKLFEQKNNQDCFSVMVGADGELRWREVLNILPKTECTTLVYHSNLILTGQLPAHSPIGKIEKIKAPLPGLLFLTENGHSLRLQAQEPLMIDILWDQLKDLQSPTWSELVQHLRLPRRLELAQNAANDILRFYSQHMAKVRSLHEALDACLAF